MPYVVRVRWSQAKIGTADASVNYLVHREESLGGRTREPHGIGESYESLKEPHDFAHQLELDALRISDARAYHIKLTVDDEAARNLTRLRLRDRERVLRRASERALRDALPLAQGLYVTHSHGGAQRAWGHPHVHAYLSPKLQSGPRLRLSRSDIDLLRVAWEREIRHALERAPRRDTAPRSLRGVSAERALSRSSASPRTTKLNRAAVGGLGLLPALLLRKIAEEEDEDHRRSRP